jgi:hypothetical protein
MASVMQAACPGCKAVLRIPAEWMGQSIRCKACGAQVQARPPVPPPPPRKAAPPPPPPRKPSPPPPPPAATTRAPLAPAAVAPPVHNAFAFDDSLDDEPGPRRPRRRKGGAGAWVALGVLLLLAGGAAGAAMFFWPQIQRAVRDPDSLAGGKKTEQGEGTATGAFPRRALVISVHNYLYANPLPNPPKDETNIQALLATLGDKLKVPADQLIHLSDAADKEPRPPLKSVIRRG